MTEAVIGKVPASTAAGIVEAATVRIDSSTRPTAIGNTMPSGVCSVGGMKTSIAQNVPMKNSSATNRCRHVFRPLSPTLMRSKRRQIASDTAEASIMPTSQ